MSLDNVNDKIIKALEDKVKILEEQIDYLRLLMSLQQDTIDCYESMEEIRNTSDKILKKLNRNTSDKILKKLKKPNLLYGRTKEWDVYDNY